jgi:DNA-binding response OmpR family regulator
LGGEKVATPGRLLLADDSRTIQKVVELILADENFEIKAFGDGEQAFEAIKSFSPNIVLADIEIPGLNGYKLCEKIKNNASTSHLPVILLAGAFEPFDEEYAKAVGADDYIIKPFESRELIAKVKSLLAGSEGVLDEAHKDTGAGEIKEPAHDVKPEWDPFPSKEDVEEILRQSVRKGVSDSMESMSAVLKEAVSSTLAQNAARIMVDVTREVVTEMVQSMRGEISVAIERIVPDVAEAVIRKEIEKITAEL